MNMYYTYVYYDVNVDFLTVQNYLKWFFLTNSIHCIMNDVMQCVNFVYFP